jgi:hypothetical protein
MKKKEKNVFCKELRDQPQQQQGGWKTHGWKHMPHTDPLHLRVYVCLQLPPVMASSVLQPAPSAITKVAQLISVPNCIEMVLLTKKLTWVQLKYNQHGLMFGLGFTY